MRCVVTGSAGLLGSRLVQRLAAHGHGLLALSRRAPAEARPWAQEACELSDRARVEQLLSEFRPEVVFHAAAATDVDGCERDPSLAWTGNVEATAHVARAAARTGAHLVHVSTDYVFDGSAGPYAEDAPLSPRGTYATTKAMAEWAAQQLAPGAAVARTSVVYGWPAGARPNFGSWLLGALSAGREVPLFEDQWVTPSLADHVAEMLVEVGERRLGGPFHLCGADVVDRVTFGRAVCERFGFDARLIRPTRLAEARLAAPRPRHAGLRVDRARRELEAQPLQLGEALDRLHAAWSGDHGTAGGRR
jgi:dTDP-4-dehydrorhamnose reductase